MPKRRAAQDEERYWKTRALLEFARVAIEVLWDILSRDGKSPF